MPDEQNDKDVEMRYSDFGLTPDEGRELQAALDPGEWMGLLAVQQLLTAAPVAAPDAAFSNRVLARLESHERARSLRRSMLGGLLVALGSLLFTGFVIWSSPLASLTQINIWMALSNSIQFLVPAMETVYLVLRTFAAVMWEGNGELLLLLLALFSLALSLLWTRIVMRPAPVNRLIRSTEA